MALTRQSSPSEIEEFQLALEELGASLPRFGADGMFGDETTRAAHDVADKYGFIHPSSQVYPTELVLAALEAAQRSRTVLHPPDEWVDLTETAYPGPRVHRVPLIQWEGVTVHQTGAAPIGGDYISEERRRKRWSYHTYVNKQGKKVVSSLKAHIGITRSGSIYLIHPLDWFIWHAQGLSKTQWGIEIECFAQGIPGDPTTTPAGQSRIYEPTPKQLELACKAIRYLDAYKFKHTGKHLTTINAHRNAKDTRRDDCGQTAYHGVVLPMMKELGLTDGGPDFVLGSGLKTPGAWNPAYPQNDY